MHVMHILHCKRHIWLPSVQRCQGIKVWGWYLFLFFLLSIPSASCYEEEFQALYLFNLRCGFTFGGSGRHLMWCECEIANIRVLLHTSAWFESSSGAGHSFLYGQVTLETTAAEKNEKKHLCIFFVSFLLLLAFISVKKKFKKSLIVLSSIWEA